MGVDSNASFQIIELTTDEPNGLEHLYARLTRLCAELNDPTVPIDIDSFDVLFN